ncbi:MAG: hypothetical protein SPL51_06560 [Lachnospiraceae bacterium]|nr:hypothetical protein [Lachnospiraceae bacterium]
MKGEQIISALIGLAGAVSNTGKSENTDEVVRTALLSIRLEVAETETAKPVTYTSEMVKPKADTSETAKPEANTSEMDKSEADESEIVDLIHKEKFKISPNCATCQFPCGNTSDYDMARFNESEENIKAWKMKLIAAMQDYLTEGNEVTEMIYRGISFLGYELDESAYANLINKINESKK